MKKKNKNLGRKREKKGGEIKFGLGKKKIPSSKGRRGATVMENKKGNEALR